DPVGTRVGGPLQQQDVLLVDLGLEVPGGLRQLRQELAERLPDPVRPAAYPVGGDEQGVLGVVGDDALPIPGGERRGVGGEPLRWRTSHRRPPSRTGPSVTCVPILGRLGAGVRRTPDYPPERSRTTATRGRSGVGCRCPD